MEIANIEKLKLLAEEHEKLAQELKIIKKEMKDLVANTQVEIDEPLSTGSRVVYKKITPKPSFNYRQYSAYLHSEIQRSTLSEKELESIMQQFTEQKPDKWRLKITK
ncbi:MULTISPECIES: hypothetical protein [unclassified Mycoplasma]|uniref:hypothetical protein n=1 Tax=unclassified Mycoplasma TaxID=2683645 RepID=UPI00211C5DAB|nr:MULTISPECIES: hypothetical protein [unclassified Mycoplasma]UUM19704.1 hypothetical protein NPA11_02955 [Mycoplasma sp. 1578d]UUM24687.1 hypothetical protein NPA12_03250 [Mycoplasma sp. 3686d]